MAEQGLRQRKKAQTHAGIVDAAMKAFLQNGYEETRLEEIAEAAGVTKRTLLRYFPTKTHLVLWSHHDALDTFKAEADARGDQSIIDIWEEHVRVNSERLAEFGEQVRGRSIATTEPGIHPAFLAIQGEYQKLIFDGLVAEFGRSKSKEILFSVAAAALVGANYHIGGLYLAREDFKGLPGAERKVIEQVKAGLLKDIIANS